MKSLNNDSTTSLAKIAINKSICKEYMTKISPRTVYLNDGDEFQIQLFNPYSYSIGAKIHINDTYLGQIFVIKPGQRVWLERYFDCNRKFRFSIYDVEADNEDVREAIIHNGEVRIDFYKEETVRGIRWDDFYYNYAKLNRYGYDTAWTSPTSDIGCTPTFSCSTTLQTKSAPMETGRIEKGSSSNQELKDVSMDFENYSFNSYMFKLLPCSQKPVYANDLDKIYCTECGRKLKQKFKFCPYCGTKVDMCNI